MENKAIKLKNIFNGEVLFAHLPEKRSLINGEVFIEVFSDKTPERKFLVNESSYRVINQKE